MILKTKNLRILSSPMCKTKIIVCCHSLNRALTQSEEQDGCQCQSLALPPLKNVDK